MARNSSKSKSRPIAGPKKAAPQSSARHSKNNKKSPPEKPGAESSGIRTIASLSKGLNEKQEKEVKRLLKEIPEAYKGYVGRRSELGKALCELQQVLATAGKNGRFKQCLDHLRIPKSTAYELIGRYESTKDIEPLFLQAADELGIDLGAPKVYSQFAELRFARQGLNLEKARKIIEPLTKKAKRDVTASFGPGITDEEKGAFKVFDAIRRSMGDFTDLQKKKALTEALNYYAHYFLGYKEPTSIALVPTKAENDWVLLPSKGKAAAKEVTCTKKL
jgi:hypothetical protein